MAYFPFMIDLKGKECLVVGGGNVARRKVESLLEFGAKVTVISPVVNADIPKVNIYKREYNSADVEGKFLVIAATDNEILNRKIASDCEELNILVNAVDIKDACSFIFPAIIKQDSLVVSVSTGGESPAGAAYLKEKLQDAIPADYEKNLATLGRHREYIISEVKNGADRKKLFYDILKHADEDGIEIDDNLVLEYIEKYKRV